MLYHVLDIVIACYRSIFCIVTAEKGSPTCNFTRAGQSFQCTAPNYQTEIVEEPIEGLQM